MRRHRQSSADYRAAVLALSPVSYWRLGEASGTVARDEMNRNHGTYVGAPTLGATGALGGDSDKAMVGTASQGYVTLPSATWNLLTAAWSISGWVKSADTARQSVLVFNSTQGLQINASAAGRLALFASPNWVLESATGAFSNGIWQHVAVTSDAGCLNVGLYVNGTRVAFSANPVNKMSDATVGGAVGGRAAGLQVLSPGTVLDEVSIWNRALSAAEIVELYRIGKGLA